MCSRSLFQPKCCPTTPQVGASCHAKVKLFQRIRLQYPMLGAPSQRPNRDVTSEHVLYTSLKHHLMVIGLPSALAFIWVEDHPSCDVTAGQLDPSAQNAFCSFFGQVSAPFSSNHQLHQHFSVQSKLYILKDVYAKYSNQNGPNKSDIK